MKDGLKRKSCRAAPETIWATPAEILSGSAPIIEGSLRECIGFWARLSHAARANVVIRISKLLIIENNTYEIVAEPDLTTLRLLSRRRWV
ncbi:hypothetical protein [Sphingobium boeckii]|uniref:Uncharacterized protein n=1 Tax=Sphingobium boeckii TaxID=1082345 RepID=A0A7W9EEN6_9SPHN|nr:hypothetical protein [Sphingobium boeckii]MBB5686372.1 hypothetical protein [Sphingobium boeckii]